MGVRCPGGRLIPDRSPQLEPHATRQSSTRAERGGALTHRRTDAAETHQRRFRDAAQTQHGRSQQTHRRSTDAAETHQRRSTDASDTQHRHSRDAAETQQRRSRDAAQTRRLFSETLGCDPVAVSMETLPSFWSRDPCDLGQSRHEAPALWDSQIIESTASPVSCAMWTDLSPHLQRNKQLHDTLVQREEELARLQEENDKLRQFLNSSFVKDLEEKAKKLFVNTKRKRNTPSSTPPISKRVCRNLTAEFCSESEPSETSLDLWVLKTLGLKDKDTIDTTTDHDNSTADRRYQSPIQDNATFCNAFRSPITANMLQTSPSENHDTKDSAFEHLRTDFSTYAYSNGQSPSKSQETSQWSSPLRTTISYNPMERLHFSPIFCSTPRKRWTGQNGGGDPSPTRSPSTRPDLAFSMSLSPNQSLKTHSFPHGQAFVRRDTQGRCNFTWVPHKK
ncbi:geminin coiled-coil domain-containing protein 1 [Eucyclogobius newberryi]|uniref:geminin coiled-coil domain-containing protein 1 n=1 Tax=Eucyclogobius newberryi TaxID=166745 RepID=UPI003B5B14C2